jgi:hypothetical protein
MTLNRRRTLALLLAVAGCGGRATSSPEAPHDAGMNEADTEAGGQGGSAGSAEGGAAGWGGSECSPDEKEAQTQSVHEALRERAPCFSGSYRVGNDDSTHFSFFLYAKPGVLTAFLCPTGDNVSMSKLHVEAASEALVGLDLSCLRGSHSNEIFGEAREQRDAVEALLAACPDWWSRWEDFLGIVFDESGQAVALEPVEYKPPAPEIEACVLGALADKTFPCLANLQICAARIIL